MPDDFAPDLGEEALVVDVDGFEGPLDVLLTLARAQKVDLRKVSILQLAERYLAFVEAARALRIELAADYLVMAAWLAFLKSRLLLPPPEAEGGSSAAEMAERLARRLERLEAMRRAADALADRARLGVDRFARGAPETLAEATRADWRASLTDLLQAYAGLKSRAAYAPLHLSRPTVLTLEDACARLSEMLGVSVEWRTLAALLPPDWMGSAARRRTAAASTFAATLELAKAGRLLMRQEAAFGPLMLRAAPQPR